MAPVAPKPSRRPIAHPLAGANLATLLAVLREGGSLPGWAWGRVALALGASLARTPSTWAERLAVAALRRGRPLTPAPVFLLGHWRSGTTHLYNVLAKGRFGYVNPIAAGLPWDFLLLGRALRPLLLRALPEGRFVDQVAVEPDSPQEDEIALANMSRLSYYHAVYFPQRFGPLFDRGLFLDGASPAEVQRWETRFDHYLWKLQRLQPDRPLLIKNPTYTGRVAQLARLYPEARFLHIVRNPHEVFASTRSFLRNLLAALALQPFDHVEVEEVVLATYERVMGNLVRDAAALPPDRFVELTFEAFERDPLGQLEALYCALGRDDFAHDRPAFEAYLAKVRSYTRAERRFPERDVTLVEARWAPFLARWGYGRPVLEGT